MLCNAIAYGVCSLYSTKATNSPRTIYNSSLLHNPLPRALCIPTPTPPKYKINCECVWVNVYLYGSECVCVNVYMYECKCVYVLMWMCICMCKYVYVYEYMFMCKFEYVNKPSKKNLLYTYNVLKSTKLIKPNPRCWARFWQYYIINMIYNSLIS